MNTTVNQLAPRSPAYADPEPPPGLREQDFRKICANGFGDGYNAYAYSMARFNGHVFVGTGRANLHLLKFAIATAALPTEGDAIALAKVAAAQESIAGRRQSRFAAARWLDLVEQTNLLQDITEEGWLTAETPKDLPQATAGSADDSPLMTSGIKLKPSLLIDIRSE